MTSTPFNDAVPDQRDQKEFPPLIQPKREIHSTTFRVLLVTIGVLFVAIGIVGWVLPFMPGVPILITGLGMIAASIPGGIGVINRCETRLPRFVRQVLRPGLRSKRKSEAQVATFFKTREVQNADT